MKLSTARLDLIPETTELLAAELAGRKAFSRQINAQVPENWPPEFYDRSMVEYTAKYLEKNPDVVGWTQWYLILRDGGQGQPVVVGISGFKGKPSTRGIVEIGYSVLKQFQRTGYATEAVAALVRWAFSCKTVQCVKAETYPELIASIRVLEKNSFRLTGKGSAVGAIRFELTQSMHLDH